MRGKAKRDPALVWRGARTARAVFGEHLTSCEHPQNGGPALFVFNALLLACLCCARHGRQALHDAARCSAVVAALGTAPVVGGRKVGGALPRHFPFLEAGFDRVGFPNHFFSLWFRNAFPPSPARRGC